MVNELYDSSTISNLQVHFENQDISVIIYKQFWRTVIVACYNNTERFVLPVIIMITSYFECSQNVLLKQMLWCLVTTHPAYQSRTHLTEEFQIKVFDARIELTSFEKVINNISWRNRERKEIWQLCKFKAEINLIHVQLVHVQSCTTWWFTLHAVAETQPQPQPHNIRGDSSQWVKKTQVSNLINL